MCTYIHFTKMFESIPDFWGEKDKRLEEYPLMDTPVRTILFSAIYLSFIKVIGPAWMKNRKPYELRAIMVAYNAILVAISAWLFLNLGFYGWFTKYSWRCEPIDTSTTPEALKMVQICWVYYFSKLLEFGDTVFFVLRKKYAQINFLHVFHHSLVPVTSWYGVSYGPGGYNTIFSLLNSFVHIWMYLYYGLSAMGPAVQKYLWWKKYLTSLQLLQFTGIVVFFTQAVFFAPKECKISGFLLALNLVQAFIFFGLFMKFYLSSYSKKPVEKYHVASVSRQHTFSGSHNKDR